MPSCVSRSVLYSLPGVGECSGMPTFLKQAIGKVFFPKKALKSADFGQTGLIFHGFWGSHFKALPEAGKLGAYKLALSKLKEKKWTRWHEQVDKKPERDPRDGLGS